MRIINQIILLCLLGILSWQAFADLYKYQDQNGNIIYTDKPNKDAEKLDLPPMQTFTPPPELNNAPKIDLDYQGNKQQDLPPEKYKMVITSPENNQVFQNDTKNIKVKLFLEPKLHHKDRIQVILNDKPLGHFYETLEIDLKELYRGEYKLQAQVVPKSGANKVKAESQTITFYQQRHFKRK